ncbi:hypothetical protein FA13DRAFT_1717866 [Coprinellus micaceus]|uniref:Uncharacterized protein n=1 Tax=Coprinellus micaceus TaxID=71717 RepID=A0A4Y7SGR2_COPMI|nr:hypothetical protein FA13DRAFT_1717866 [Coprinellus micaceus]
MAGGSPFGAKLGPTWLGIRTGGHPDIPGTSYSDHSVIVFFANAQCRISNGPGTVDYYMSMLARGKALISEAFLTTEKQKKLAKIIEGDDPALGDSLGDSDDEEGGGSAPKARKPKGKKSKTLVHKQSVASIATLASAKGGEDDEAPPEPFVEPSAEPAPPPPEDEKKKKKKKKKTKVVAPESDDDSNPILEVSTRPAIPDSLPPATEKKVKKKKSSKKVASAEIVDDSEPERERKAKLHQRAPNRKIVLDMAEEGTAPRAQVDDEDVAMRTASDSDAFMSVPSLPPPSSRSSSKVRSDYSAAGVSISSKLGLKGGNVPGVSEYSSSSSDEDPPPKPKPTKRNRSDSSQQVTSRSGTTSTKRQKQPADPSPEPELEPEFMFEPASPPPEPVSAEDWADFSRQVCPPFEDDEFPSSQEEEREPLPPVTQRPPPSNFAQKSSSMVQFARRAEADLMERRMLGGSDPSARRQGSSTMAAPASPRKARAGIAGPGTSSQARSGIPKLANPFAGTKKNPFASSSKRGGS